MPIPTVLLTAAQSMFDEASNSTELTANTIVIFNAKRFKVRCRILKRLDGSTEEVLLSFLRRQE